MPSFEFVDLLLKGFDMLCHPWYLASSRPLGVGCSMEPALMLLQLGGMKFDVGPRSTAQMAFFRGFLMSVVCVTMISDLVHLEQGLVWFIVLVAQAGIVTEPQMEWKVWTKTAAESCLARCFWRNSKCQIVVFCNVLNYFRSNSQGRKRFSPWSDGHQCWHALW